MAQFFESFLDFLFPSQCLICEKNLIYAQEICKSCLSGMDYISPPICLKCGVPFHSETEKDHLCGSCLTSSVYFTTARAVGHYDGMLQEAIHQFKYKGKTLLAKPLGALMGNHNPDAIDFESYDLLVPVPLHLRRLRERGFNQALSLAKCLGEKYRIPIDCMGLKRTRWTEPQINLTRKERQRNVQGVFSIHDKDRFRSRNILLIDDVYTSGSTVNECAKVLMNAGTARVDVFTLCRAV